MSLGDHFGGGGPCCVTYPTGWGGTITDTIGQVRIASEDAGATEITIGVNDNLEEAKESQISDPAWVVVCGDASDWGYAHNVSRILYSLCRLPPGCGYCCMADWENCPDTQNCALDRDEAEHWLTDPSFRAKYTRHLGGSNVGFADGHAAWWHAEALSNATPYCVCDCPPKWYNTDGKIRGLCPLGLGNPPGA